MLYFENDYCEGAHPAILQKLIEIGRASCRERV